jgi:leader peptidase (prepilin peptidase) / N-methyltransferase
MHMTAVIYGLFGLIIGSFTNVVIFRSGVVSIFGRSGCMSCGAKIRWFDLIPVLSWIALRGKCRSCRSRISIQYPIVEFLMGTGFALVGASPLLTLEKMLGLLIFAILIAITVYDIRHTIIPDMWVWIFNALALVSVFVSPLQATSYWLPAVLSGPIVAFPLFALWLVSRGKWIGLGDSKLALGIGWLIGPLAGIQALFLAFITGAIFGLVLIFFSSATWSTIVKRFIPRAFWHKAGRRITMKSEVPFGPFLIAACLLVWWSQIYNVAIPFLWQ